MPQTVLCVGRTPANIAGFRPKYAGVGSRETPTDVLSLMMRIAHYLCDAGWLGQSGDADGADSAFHAGAMRSHRYRDIGFAAYLPWNGVLKKSTGERRYHNPSLGLYDASTFDNWEAAKELAFSARGGFHGLGRGGIALHTRNCYQVLSPSLQDPVQRLFCWAVPIAKGKVSGGTNTAVQIARTYHVPIVNLYNDSERNTVEQYLASKEY